MESQIMRSRGFAKRLRPQRRQFIQILRVLHIIAFDERFAEELARWTRLRHPMAILVWDVDRLKSINEVCGHRGGDEFVSLLVGAETADAMRVEEQTRASVEALKFHFHGAPAQVTVSCGLTSLRDGDSADTVFDRAVGYHA